MIRVSVKDRGRIKIGFSRSCKDMVISVRIPSWINIGKNNRRVIFSECIWQYCVNQLYIDIRGISIEITHDNKVFILFRQNLLMYSLPEGVVKI